jgi:hypothetical protein
LRLAPQKQQLLPKRKRKKLRLPLPMRPLEL